MKTEEEMKNETEMNYKTEIKTETVTKTGKEMDAEELKSEVLAMVAGGVSEEPAGTVTVPDIAELAEAGIPGDVGQIAGTEMNVRRYLCMNCRKYLSKNEVKRHIIQGHIVNYDISGNAE